MSYILVHSPSPHRVAVVGPLFLSGHTCVRGGPGRNKRPVVYGRRANEAGSAVRRLIGSQALPMRRPVRLVRDERSWLGGHAKGRQGPLASLRVGSSLASYDKNDDFGVLRSACAAAHRA